MSKPLAIVSVSLLSGLVGAGAVVAVVALGPGSGDETGTVLQQSPLAAARADQEGLTARDIYRRAAPGVLFVRAEGGRKADSPYERGRGRGDSTGTGFAISRDGLVVTNAHVVDGASSISVRLGSRRERPAKLVGQDRATDLALLKVDARGLDLRPLPMGDSRTVRVGDSTIAIGNPLGLDRTLTTGVVSALQRRIEAPGGFAVSDVIQTDAAIDGGNCGGPLLNAAGQVIGVNAQIATRAPGGQGKGRTGFAVPIATAKAVIPELKASGSMRRPFLGVGGEPAEDGLRVLDVKSGSAAARAGIRGAVPDAVGAPMGGDVIARLDGRRVGTMDELEAHISKHEVGDRVEIELVRDGRRDSAQLRLGTRP